MTVSRRLTDGTRYLALRRYSTPRSSHEAAKLIAREVDALTVVRDSRVPVAAIVGADPHATHCEYPSLLLDYLPGSALLLEPGIAGRVPLLAQTLVDIHSMVLATKPPVFQALTTPESVVIPASGDRALWARAVELIDGPTPAYRPVPLHGDFQPGNVLFDVTATNGAAVSGVIDWSGLCWGPVDFDVAHCATNLALLHGVSWAHRFVESYEAAGGVLISSHDARRYWLVRDALACSEEFRAWAAPWRRAGRTDLTDEVVESRLCMYLERMMDAGGG